MRVLMTGSHGFVGSNMIEVLSGEHEIIRWDVRSDDALPECDAVIHLAGKAHDVTLRQAQGPNRNRKEEEYYEVNTELTKKIFDAFLRSEAKKFIFFSSIKAKDNGTPYARSKRAAEDYIMNEISRQARDDKFQTRDDNNSTCSTTKRVYILRPCMIHGKGVKGNLPLLFKFVKKGWPWPLAAFENQRSYASMGNVAFIVNELLKKDVVSGIYNICDDESVSTNDLIRLMGDGLGHNAKMLSIPIVFIRLIAKAGDVLHLPLNTERLRKLTGDYIVDNSEIKRALGISTMPVRVLEGLKATIEELKMK